MGMTEAEMDAADPKELAAKVKNATDILYQVIVKIVDGRNAEYARAVLVATLIHC